MRRGRDIKVSLVVVFALVIAIIMMIPNNQKENKAKETAEMVSSVVEIIPQVEEEVESEYPRFVHSKDWGGEDGYLLAKIAECEAGNQSLETRSMVILTILNRVWSPQFPDTIEDVIYQQSNGVHQFSPLVPGGSWWYIEPSEESWEAVSHVMKMEYDTSEGCLFFESFISEEAMLNSWHHNNLTYLFQLDDMRFYK